MEIPAFSMSPATCTGMSFLLTILLGISMSNRLAVSG